MGAIFKECAGCLATPFCKVFSGTVTPSYKDWCRGRLKLDKALELSLIPEEYIGANIYNASLDDQNKAAFQQLKPRFQNILDEVDSGTCFFIHGSKTGSGKTYLAAAILNQFIYKTCMTSRFDFENSLGLFVVYPDLMDDLRYRRDDFQVQQRMAILREVPLLLLDDVGAGTMSDFVREQTFLLLNHRLNRKLSNIITSNYSIKSLNDDSKLGSRVASRMTKRTIGVELNGRDRRLS